MNDEQKSKLCRLLDSLIVAEANVMNVISADRLYAMSRREALFNKIIVFAESLGEPVTAVLDTTDPRAGLRRCEAKNIGCAFFHLFYVDADQEPMALIEYPDGCVGSAWYEHVRFTDIPESEER